MIEADNGRVALDLLGDDGAGIDVVLLDLVMPELDGFAVLAAIRGDPSLARIPVIVVSGLDDLDGIVRCVEMGAADYLPRPIKPTLLRARVNASLADKRLRDDNARLLATVDRQREELSRFLSPQVAALVSTPEGEQLLAGHRRVVTAVFCDLRGYTAFGEIAEPEELLDVVREYHAAMGRRIMEFEGTLEHFAGDGMHIFFNDPVLQPDHQLRAVRMAAAMRDDVLAAAAGWAKRGYDLGFGVGIAEGFATAGRIGYEGPLRLRGDRQRRDPRGAPERQGGHRADPRLAAVLRGRRGGRRGGGGRRPRAEGDQPPRHRVERHRLRDRGSRVTPPEPASGRRYEVAARRTRPARAEPAGDAGRGSKAFRSMSATSIRGDGRPSR